MGAGRLISCENKTRRVRFPYPLLMLICPVCQIEFEGKRYNSKFCSKTCYDQDRKRYHKERNKTYKRATIPKICKECGIEFQCSNQTNKRFLCSMACQRSYVGRKNRKFIDIPSCLENPARKLDKNIGYVRIYVPMHPEANTRGYVYEHRMIAEQMIGRRLVKGEIVHHKNGKRHDNRPENLEVMDKHEHARLHGQRDEDKDI